MKNIFIYIMLSVTAFSYAEGMMNCDTSAFNKRKNGKKQGVWQKKYFLSQKLRATCEFENGKRSGHYYKYYKSGYVKIIGKYVNNRKNGSECFYRDKVRGGESIKYCIDHENGKKKKAEIIWEGM